jgi:hypothetical protein
MKEILYHGNDQDFFEKLSEAAAAISDCRVTQQAPVKGTLIRTVFKLKPHIIVVDVASATYLSEELRQVKKISDFKSVLIVGFCKDDLEVKIGESLLVSGAHLFHLMDTDSDTFFRDCFQIAFEASTTVPDFARAKNLEIPLELGFLSTFASTGSDNFLLETDLLLSTEVSLRFPMLQNSPALSAKITENYKGSLTAPCFHSYRVDFPYPGPWDEVTENSLSRETVETWIDLKGIYFDGRKETLAIFTADNEFTSELLSCEGAAWYQIYRSVDEAESSLFHLRPGLIFFDLHDKEGTDLGALAEVIECLRGIIPAPMLLVFGSKTESKALQKLFDYESVISTPGKPDLGMFLAMEKKFLLKTQNQRTQFYLSPGDPDRIVLLMKEVTLTSLTERDVTFILDSEIPYFSVIRTELPLPMYLTVIPAEGQLALSSKGTHYRALIHGLTEENLAKIRKIVNQLIYTPVKELTRENVEIMLKQDYVQKEKQLATERDGPHTLVKITEEPERFEIKKKFRGNSKL